jgi:hypothetical protein
MTGTTASLSEGGEADDEGCPVNTAILRPLRHVRAVRQRYLQRFADPADAATSLSARAWARALGEIAVAPVSGRDTAVPPHRAEIDTVALAVHAQRGAMAKSLAPSVPTGERQDAARTLTTWMASR